MSRELLGAEIERRLVALIKEAGIHPLTDARRRRLLRKHGLLALGYGQHGIGLFALAENPTITLEVVD